MVREEQPFISLIVPAYNEESAIRPFLDAVLPVLSATGCRYQLIFVNDGSTDQTRAGLRAAKAENPEIILLNLTRNFGKEAALTAGLDHATGDVVIPIDIDLQDPPDLIPELLARWREGADIVYAIRRSRSGDNFFKRLTANGFYKLFNRMSSVRIPAEAGDFRLLDRRVVREIVQLREKTRFMKGLMAWPGFSSASVLYDRPARDNGSSRWNYPRLINFAMDGLTSFSTVPLRIALFAGAFVSLLSLIYAAFIVCMVLETGNDVPGYPSLMTAIMFFGGIQLISIGLVGEYVGRIFHEVKDRPIYLIDNEE